MLLKSLNIVKAYGLDKNRSDDFTSTQKEETIKEKINIFKLCKTFSPKIREFHHFG